MSTCPWENIQFDYLNIGHCVVCGKVNSSLYLHRGAVLSIDFKCVMSSDESQPSKYFMFQTFFSPIHPILYRLLRNFSCLCNVNSSSRFFPDGKALDLFGGVFCSDNVVVSGRFSSGKNKSFLA